MSLTKRIDVKSIGFRAAALWFALSLGACQMRNSQPTNVPNKPVPNLQEEPAGAGSSDKLKKGKERPDLWGRAGGRAGYMY